MALTIRHARSAGSGRSRWAASGVVYSDIGTSPLYAVLAASGTHAAVGAEVILGILSLIIWALVLIVSVKYVIILLRADAASRLSAWA
jgi:K+ transporter